MGLLGIMTTLFVVVSLATAIVVSLRRPWMRVVVRVAGSWIVATGILMLGWHFRVQSSESKGEVGVTERNRKILASEQSALPQREIMFANTKTPGPSELGHVLRIDMASHPSVAQNGTTEADSPKLSPFVAPRRTMDASLRMTTRWCSYSIQASPGRSPSPSNSHADASWVSSGEKCLIC